MTTFSVNGDEVSLSRALAWSSVEDPEPFLDLTVERAVLVQYSIHSGIELTADDLQQAVNEFRYEMGIDSADETRRWLKANHMDERAMADACRLRALRSKLLLAIEDTQIAETYQQLATELETASLYAITLPTRREAEKMADQLRNGTLNFHLAALEHSTDETTRPAAGYLGEVTRADLPETVAISVFSVDPGDIVGPLKNGTEHDIYLVSGFQKPPIGEVEPEIRQSLLAEQLGILARQAVVMTGN